MNSFFSKSVFGHPFILASGFAVAVIALLSGIYYTSATRTPALSWATPARGSISQVVTGTGIALPAQNPDIAFQSGGRIVSVNAVVGQRIAQGQLLAALDTGSLSAQRAQAVANVKAEQAKLDEMQAGARGVDVAAKQTEVAQAQQSLANMYANVPASLTDAYDKTFSGVRADTDSLFTDPTTTHPVLVFQSTDSQVILDAGNTRSSLNISLPAWKVQIDAVTQSSSPASMDVLLAASIAQLSTTREYTSTLLRALAGAIAAGPFPQSSILSAQASVGALNDSINAMIMSLQNEQQQLASAKLAVQSAEDAQDQVVAGATGHDIEAQQAAVEGANASVQSIDAQLRNAVIVAPFSGVVSSVSVKSGQIVAPSTIALSLTPQSALQIEVYLSEVDAAKLVAGDKATVTLDAYGSGRIFQAHVASVDHSPTSHNGSSGFKTTLQFESTDPAISSGLTANVTITVAQKNGVLIIPKTAIIQNGTETFVLTPGPNGPVQKMIQTGIESTDMVEVISGLKEGDQFLAHTK